MENPREHVPPVSGTSVSPQSTVTQGQYYVHTPPAPPKPGFGTVFFRTLRLLLRRFLYVLAIVGRPLRPFAGFLIVILALIGVIGWMSFALWGPKSGAPRDSRVTFLAPAAAVENYIKGQQDFDASAMWASLSDDYQAEQLAKGVTQDNLQSRIDSQKRQGIQFSKFDYVGGKEINDGGKMFIYSVDVEVKSNRGSEKGTLPITFMVDQDNKVVRIMGISPFPSE